jgi:hypothetical protein
MDRLRPLDPPHKGLRHGLGQLSLALGTTDFGDVDDVARLRALTAEVVTLLHDHARQEDLYIFAPAERFVPGSSAVDREHHAALHASVESIHARIDALDPGASAAEIDDIVRAFRSFHVDYLVHMDHEESALEPILIAHQTDEEMIADQGVIMQTVPFETLLLWFKYIVPARGTRDNRQVLAGFKSAAPAEAFDAVCALLRDVLPPDRYSAITDGL